jgi:hypothetical protein
VTAARDPKQLIGAMVALLGFAAVGFGCSYLEERPRHAFEAEALSFDDQPGTRLIDTVRTGSITSPFTWIRPNRTGWRYAIPDAVQPERFTLVSATYGYDPTIRLIDADCEERDLYVAGLDEPVSSPPMRDFLGRPETSNDGRVFRMIETTRPADPALIAAFCDTSWDVERAEILALEETPL